MDDFCGVGLGTVEADGFVPPVVVDMVEQDTLSIASLFQIGCGQVFL